MQVLEDHDERLVQAFAQQQALDRVERTAPSDFGIKARELIVAFRHLEQSEKIRQSVLQRSIEDQDLSGYSLAALARVVFRGNREIVFEQVDERQVCGGLGVR